jgi:hypothetical protein
MPCIVLSCHFLEDCVYSAALYEQNILVGEMQHILILLVILSMTASVKARPFNFSDIPSTPEMPLTAPLPTLPDACAGQPAVSGDETRFVTVYGNVDWEGRATQVQITNPSDDCLKDMAVEAVRNWTFEPVEPDTEEYWRLSFETTLIYSAGEPPRFEMSAPNSVVRYPPRYPDMCFNGARRAEIVAFTFDVTEENVTDNIEVYHSTRACLTKAATNSLKKWKYSPRLINGRAYPRKDVYTEISFMISDTATTSVRSEILRELLSISLTLDRNLDPRIALEKIAWTERRYERKFNDSEWATLLRYRGAAKIDALDYPGALDDLRAALELEKSASVKEGIENVIGQLESALSASDVSVSEGAPVSDGN